MSRLSVALACYVLLGVLSWSTIAEPRLRYGTLLVLGWFAVKSVWRRNDVLHPDKKGDADG